MNHKLYRKRAQELTCDPSSTMPTHRVGTNAEMAQITHATRATRATIDTLKMTQAQTVNQAITKYRCQRTSCSHHAQPQSSSHFHTNEVANDVIKIHTLNSAGVVTVSQSNTDSNSSTACRRSIIPWYSMSAYESKAVSQTCTSTDM